MDLAVSLPKIDSIISSYISGKKKEALSDKYDKLSNRVADTKFYLAIVGEFSSGKSTFINALLRKRLLKEAVKPTTAAATFIEKKGHVLNIEVVFDDNRNFYATEINKLELCDYIQCQFNVVCNTLKDLIDGLTSIQEIALHVQELYINIPDANIPQGVVLIDTPGFNPGDEAFGNHFEVTKSIVENVADMALILMPSEQTMSASIKDFMKNSLLHYLHRCRFIITKGDNLPSSERDIVTNFLREQLCSNFSIQSPKIYIESAIASLPVATIPESKRMEWNMWKNKFSSFEQETWKTLAQQKDTIIAEHINNILNELLVELRKTLQQKQNELKQEQKILGECKLEHIEVVTNKLLEQSTAQVKTKIATIKRRIESQITSAILYSQTFADNTINAASDGMYNFETKEKVCIENEVKSKSRKLVDELNHQTMSALRRDVKTVIKDLRKQFESHYSMFPALQRNVSVNEISIYDISVSSLSFSTSAYIEKKESEENQAAGAGAIIGGILGFLVGGPIGAAALAALGGAGGVVAGNTVEEKKSGVKEILRKDIKIYFDKILIQIRDVINARQRHIIQELNKLCSDHINKYGDDVVSIIRKHKQQETLLSKKIQSIHKDRDYLEDSEEIIKRKLLELKYRN
ncbi:dynamin family protein [Bacteroides salyersiae]|uniref:dynamin family protein n=1 Tax=Bacteroides salyersiae TaxID=291644 RepID=UPI001C38C1D8|nr:dynamin family protein [Bacteroides salyersiae]MBV4203540.1 dynamin family protein [Bacteroides salyersiae]MCB6648890.1 dynamin family protein [Bacteroides salyersiae]